MERRLYRSIKNRTIGGVCSGVAEYLNIDPVIVKLITVGCLFLGGITFWLYLIAWALIPEEVQSN